jgi:transposase
MRAGWYYRKAENGDLVRVEHPMQKENGIQKGLRTILTERGKFHNNQGHQLCKVCRPCLNKTPHSERENKTEKCCAFYVLSQEPDFLEQKPWLTEVVMGHQFNIHYYPKYHCELNWIEMIWGWVKSYHRRNCTYSFADLDGEEGLTKTLNERIPLSFVRKAARHSLRYMHYYRLGLEGHELEFAVKKYKSHRDISSAQRAMIKSAFEEHCRKRARTS